MANHKSAVKSHKRSEKNRARNTSIITKIKTFIKKFEAMIVGGDANAAKEAMRAAESQIMKGVSKGVLKKNTAARKVSKLSKQVKKLESK